MLYYNRRRFLKNSALLAGAAITGSAFQSAGKELRLSFSTLGCPDWSFQQIVDFAAAHGYTGLEIRGIKRELDLSKCAEFSTPEARKATAKLLEDKKLQLVNLGSSANLHFKEGPERTRNLDEGRRFIDLAHQVGCPYIRVFPNNFPAGQDQKQTIGLIAKGLLELAGHASGSGVTVLMETHGDLVKIDDVDTIMQAAAHPQVGLIWDVANMWTITREPVAEAWARLNKYIRHTHIKDAKLTGGKIQYTLLGQGETPIFEAIDLMAIAGYKGFYSFEWEKMWHPEIAEPEIALADYSKAMQQHALK